MFYGKVNAFQFEVDLFKLNLTLEIKQWFAVKKEAVTTSNQMGQFKLKSEFFPHGQFNNIDSYIHEVCFQDSRVETFSNLVETTKP